MLPIYFESFIPEYGDYRHNLRNDQIRLPLIRSEYGEMNLKYHMQVQLGPRYEGQLNPMAEPIPHEVRALVRTHVYHPYHAADRQAETDSWV